jgi:hypothetical protein
MKVLAFDDLHDYTHEARGPRGFLPADFDDRALGDDYPTSSRG